MLLLTVSVVVLPMLAAPLAAAAQAAPAAPPRAEAAFELPGMTGLVEGIAVRPQTGAYYFGDVRKRCVWRRDADGRVTRFGAPDDRLLGVFRLVVDEGRGALVAAMSALPQMEGYRDSMQGAAGIAELDLETGAVRRVALVPADGANHVVGDLAVAADGTIYATDSAAPILWRLLPLPKTPGSVRPADPGLLDVFVRSELFGSLQGITTDGGSGLFLTDYKTGVVHVDTATKQVRRLTAPADTNLRGLDTLLRTPSGALVAIQNGTKTQRVLRLTVDPVAAAVARVEAIAEDPAMVDATLGTIAGRDFVFIADGGWNLFEPGAPAPPARVVPVLKVPLER
jgi:hypothetical protein